MSETREHVASMVSLAPNSRPWTELSTQSWISCISLTSSKPLAYPVAAKAAMAGTTLPTAALAAIPTAVSASAAR